MKSQIEIWIQNINLLAEEIGSKKDLAEKVGVTSSYIYQITNHAKKVSDKAIRRIEVGSDLPKHSLDEELTPKELMNLLTNKPKSNGLPELSLDYNVLVECVDDALAVSSLDSVDSTILARVIVALYESRIKKDNNQMSKKDAI